MGRLSMAVASLALVAGGVAQATGDAARGREVAVVCAPCHGHDGVSPSPAFPILAGQFETYLATSIRAYQGGQRTEAVMSEAVRTLTAQQIDDVAAWYASQQGLAAPRPTYSGPDEAALAAAVGAGADARAAGPAVPARAMSPAPAAAAPPPRPPTAADELAACPVDNPNLPETQDFDRDGLPDRYDAAPADASEFAKDGDGDGWYEICDIRQLQAIRTLGAGAGNATGLGWPARAARRYELARDLDAGVIVNFLPIGDCGPQQDCTRAGETLGFTGSLEGHSHVIRRLRIARPETGGVGLFGVVAQPGAIRGVVLEKADVTGLHGVGALVGINFGLVADCRTSGRVTGKNATGALLGRHAGRLIGCAADGEVTGSDAVGGLVGEARGIVARSRASTRVTGRGAVGGLVGRNLAGAVVSSYATGRVRGENDVGGLVGESSGAVIGESYATAGVEATGTRIGGLAGANSRGAIRNSYARGEVRGVHGVGGLAGVNTGSIRASYATGHVRGSARAGGLVGDNSRGTVSASYWDARATGRAFGAGNDDASPDGADDNRLDPGEIDSLAAYAKSAAALRVLDGRSSGWLPGARPLDGHTGAAGFYCDANADGRIGNDEQRADNVAWDFGNEAELPRLRCPGTDLADQPAR